MPPLARFTTPSFVVQCQLERWEIVTEQPAVCDRCLEASARVFEILAETPIKSYGFNFTYQRATACADVGERLSAAVRGAGVGFPDVGGLGSLKYVSKEGVCRTTATVESSLRDKSMVVVALNMHYEIGEMVEGAVHFDLRKLIAPHFHEARARANRRSDAIVGHLGQKEGADVGGR